MYTVYGICILSWVICTGIEICKWSEHIVIFLSASFPKWTLKFSVRIQLTFLTNLWRGILKNHTLTWVAHSRNSQLCEYFKIWTPGECQTTPTVCYECFACRVATSMISIPGFAHQRRVVRHFHERMSKNWLAFTREWGNNPHHKHVELHSIIPYSGPAIEVISLLQKKSRRRCDFWRILVPVENNSKTMACLNRACHECPFRPLPRVGIEASPSHCFCVWTILSTRGIHRKACSKAEAWSLKVGNSVLKVMWLAHPWFLLSWGVLLTGSKVIPSYQV